MIRFILVCIIVVGFLILSIPVLLAEWIIGKFRPHTKDISSLRIVQSVFRAVLKVTGADITIIGHEKVPRDTPVLYIGNHRSFFDILLTYVLCENPTGYIAKKEMESIPLLSNWMKYLHCLFLNRTDLKEGMKTIMAAIEEVKKGISICIFPEGTRNKEASELDLMEFHEGSFRIATKSGCPVIPMAITNSSQIFEDHFPKIKPCRVIVEYGEPIYPDQLDKQQQKHLGSYTRGILLEMLTAHQEADM